MTDRIKLVQGDTGPQVRLTLKDQVTGVAKDITGATVTLHFRASESGTVLFSRQATINPVTALTGIAVVEWEEGDLDVEPGNYEGEIEVIDAFGLRETVFEVLKFKIRAEFA